ncbi:hypothetical protein M3Y99_01822600 [Aphelenchoides fujianensis]|nr:hypothetical protein M3Y99_01822600 [Aphelenchoides fujianensis]
MRFNFFLSLLVAALVVETVVACASTNVPARHRRSADQTTIALKTNVKPDQFEDFFQKFTKASVELDAITSKCAYVQQDLWLGADGNYAIRTTLSDDADCADLRQAVQKMVKQVPEITNGEVYCAGQPLKACIDCF